MAAKDLLNKHRQYFLPIKNYPQFILNHYQEVGQTQAHTTTPKNSWSIA